MTTGRAFQDLYQEKYAHCFGCGRLNDHGLHIQSFWDGDESVCTYEPEAFYTGGYPENLYGGLIASLMDCHSAGTAMAAAVRARESDPSLPVPERFVTASLKVDYLAPTPVGPLEIRGKIRQVDGRKTWIDVSVHANGKETARGEVLQVQIPV